VEVGGEIHVQSQSVLHSQVLSQLKKKKKKRMDIISDQKKRTNSVKYKYSTTVNFYHFTVILSIIT
jgi:hypothetical protein